MMPSFILSYVTSIQYFREILSLEDNLGARASSKEP